MTTRGDAIRTLMTLLGVTLAAGSAAATATVHQKISDFRGNFSEMLFDGDDFGLGTAGIGDLDGDGVPDMAVGARRDDDGGTDRGAVWILFLNADGSVQGHQKISHGTGGFPFGLDDEDRFGQSIASLGDLNGDGIDDLAVGAYLDDGGGVDRGAVWILFLNADGTVQGHQKIGDGLGGFPSGLLDDHDNFGISLARVVDLDGDGRSELAVGAHLDDDFGNNTGAVWILFPNADGSVASYNKIASSSLDPGDRFGFSVMGDPSLQGIAVGAIGDDDGGTDRGAIYLIALDLSGGSIGSSKISDTFGSFTGELDDGDAFGASLTAIGDLDGDGHPDAAVGALGDDDGGSDRGAVWIVFLDIDFGTAKGHEKISDATVAFGPEDLDDGDGFGWTSGYLGDVNADGIDDLVVGAPGDDDGDADDDGVDRGAVWVLPEPASRLPHAAGIALLCLLYRRRFRPARGREAPRGPNAGTRASPRVSRAGMLHPIWVLCAFALAAAAAMAHSSDPAPRPSSGLPAVFGSMPLGFEENRGQADDSVAYFARGAGYQVALGSEGVSLALSGPGVANALHLELIGASWAAGPSARDPLPGRVHYLKGPRSAWRANLPTYQRIAYRDVYPGVELVLYGNQRELEYDFVIAPGADPARIALRWTGASGLSLTPEGDLRVETSAGDLRQSRPVAYQEIAGERREVAARYRIEGDEVAFELGGYDRTRALTIDPIVQLWSTFHGGASGYEWGSDVFVDEEGFVYVAGYTFSSDHPVTQGAYATTFGGLSGCAPGQDPGATPPFPTGESCISDAFVSKLAPDGSTLVYSTFLGGNASDRALGLAVVDGFAYLTGGTNSLDFPTTPGAADACLGGALRDIGLGLMVLADVFVTKLSQDGSSLVYSTCLSGTDNEEAQAIAVDASGRAVVAGQTFSTDFPTTEGAHDRDLNGPGSDPHPCASPSEPTACLSDAFVARLDPLGETIEYSTYLGGSGLEFAFGLALDAAGAAYVTGDTTSPEGDFPITAGVVGPTHHHDPAVSPCDSHVPIEIADCVDAYVVKLAPDGSAVSYATFLGGSGHEHGHDVEVRQGEAFVVGHTFSADFPVTSGALDTSVGGEDAFAARLTSDASSLVYATYLGGAAWDFAAGMAVDDAGATHLVGLTGSDDYPVTADALDPSFNGAAPCNRGEPPVCLDGFHAVLAPDGASLIYSSYLGGAGPDTADAVALFAGVAYVTGVTFSPDFPTSAGVRQPVFAGPGGQSDAYVMPEPGLPASLLSGLGLVAAMTRRRPR